MGGLDWKWPSMLCRQSTLWLMSVLRLSECDEAGE